MLKNVQPFVAGYRFGSVAVAHNGNLINYTSLRASLEDTGSIFNTTSDTEVVLHLIAISKARPFFLRIVDACEQLQGAYSMVFLTEDKLVAVRDPHGFRPLVMGRRSNGSIVFASETCALDLIEATYEREVNPGEVLVVDKDGVKSMCLLPHFERKACIFEHIYFAQPNSVVFGRSVYQSRRKYGEILATKAPVDCDVVIAVPDSGMVAALGYAAKAGVPFEQGLIRSHYVGRTFIEPSQKIRDFGVKLKLAPVRAVLEGKRVVVVDDSIVRGTTSSKIVRLLKEAGAKEVHMRIASPPIIGSCYYGVDTPSSEELISNRMTVEEVRDFIGCDSLAFLPFDSLKNMLGEDSNGFCYACFSGNYPVLPRELKVKRVGDFLDDGLNGSVKSIDGAWIQVPKNQTVDMLDGDENWENHRVLANILLSSDYDETNFISIDGAWIQLDGDENLGNHRVLVNILLSSGILISLSVYVYKFVSHLKHQLFDSPFRHHLDAGMHKDIGGDISLGVLGLAHVALALLCTSFVLLLIGQHNALFT
ncbi:hypothetical protein Scep_029067 [Stephania cephalantha]|uniref:amidophosphoribosyltransferase n=1 Tax=Stephania cephalantha TaxID=152367 RepID=A0AAP0DX46_9MAGN